MGGHVRDSEGIQSIQVKGAEWAEEQGGKSSFLDE